MPACGSGAAVWAIAYLPVEAVHEPVLQGVPTISVHTISGAAL